MMLYSFGYVIVAAGYAHYSRTSLTRTPKGNVKQFELAGLLLNFKFSVNNSSKFYCSSQSQVVLVNF